VLLVIIVSIIYIFATATSRTHIFTAFWTTHQLFYALYVVILLHGSVRLVQQPYFPYYFGAPALLFTLDKLVSLSRKKRQLSVVRAELLPSGTAKRAVSNAVVTTTIRYDYDRLRFDCNSNTLRPFDDLR